MKKRKLIISAVFLAVLFLFPSCYTNKKGIVPCPHGYNDVLKVQKDKIPSEPV